MPIASRPLVVLVLVLATRATAAADEPPVPYLEEHGEERTAAERPFGFVEDPTGPGAGVTTLGYRLGVASGIAADRPLPISVGSAGLSHMLEAGFGITQHLSAFTAATLEDGGAAVLRAGAKLMLTPADWSFRLSVSGLGLYETGDRTKGMAMQVAASQDLGRVRVATTVLAEKAFADNRDDIDAMVMLGASYHVVGGVRVGAEYIAQDLEELVSAGAEGGARQAVGPTLALDLEGGRYQAVASVAFGVTRISPRALARIGIATSF